MRKIFLSFLILAILAGCKKNYYQPDTVLVDLGIIFTMTATTTTQGQEIKAKGTYPNSNKADIVCLQAIYYADTSLKINATTKGQYVLKFYNNNLLFKADTVQVN
jgi:hypothetical protein